MGYFKDEHIILTCGEAKPLEKIRNKILDLIQSEFEADDLIPDYSNYISPVLTCLANSLHALFIPADGSKEGWGTSNNMDEVREKLRAEIIHHNARSKEKIDYILVTEYEQMSDADTNTLTAEKIVEGW